MKVTHLLDTDICIEVIRRVDAVLMQRVADPEVRAAVSTISVHELEFGVAKSADPSGNQLVLDAFLVTVVPVAFDAPAAAHAGRLRGFLKAHGTPVGPYDVLIAGQALALNLPLVTRNVREFRRVPDLDIVTW